MPTRSDVNYLSSPPEDTRTCFSMKGLRAVVTQTNSGTQRGPLEMNYGATSCWLQTCMRVKLQSFVLRATTSDSF